MVGVVYLLGQVWQWHSDPNACGDTVACQRGFGVSRLDGNSAMQHAAVPRELRRQWLVDLVRLLCQVRRRHPDANAYHYTAASQPRCTVPGVDAIAVMQHARVPEGLRLVRLVGLVRMFSRRLWWRYPDTYSLRCAVAQRRRCFVPLADVGVAGMQHTRMPSGLWSQCMVSVVYLLCHMWRRHSNADAYCHSTAQRSGESVP